jgi:hypothetical protein
MNNLVAEGLFLFSALATIVIMLMIIAKERRKRKAEDEKRAKKHTKSTIHHRPETLHLN